MVKKITIILVTLVFLGYLIFSVFSLTKKPDVQMVCHDIDVQVYDSLHYDLINKKMIVNMLNRRGINPIGKPIDGINTDEMEQMLLSHSLISDAQCYKTIGGNIKIKLVSRVPVLRVMNNRGQDFYLDSHGEILNNTSSIVVNLPVATGNISQDYAKKELMYLISILNSSDFWKAQVEQIWVSTDKEITLVPRVGGHLLLLGHAENIEDKLDRLQKFYKKGLDVIGWSKYSSICVAYDKQVVCKIKK